MSRLAAERIAQSPNGPARVRQLQGDVRAARLYGRYDLVIAHFFLDSFTTEELQTLIPRIAAHVIPGARWLISEFQIPASGLRRYVAKVVVKALYVSFGLLTGLKAARLPNYGTILEASGYLRTASKTGIAGLLVSEMWEHV